MDQNSTCNYTEIIGYIIQLKKVATEATTLLDKPRPKYNEFDKYDKQYQDLLAKLSPAVQNYILDNDKSCYFNVRTARPSSLLIAGDVLSIIFKCIAYVDVNNKNKRCSNRL